MPQRCLSFLLTCAVAAACAPATSTGDFRGSDAIARAACAGEDLYLESEYGDVFTVEVPQELCGIELESPEALKRIEEIGNSLLYAANTQETPVVAALQSPMQSAAGAVEVEACCRIKVKWRVVVPAPSVTVSGTSVTVSAPITVSKPEVTADLSVPSGGASATGNVGGCSHMMDLGFIPAGHHPSSVNWKPGDSRGDLVCVSKTEGNEIIFVPWLDAPRPAGYHVLYQYPNPTTTFNGCRQWTLFQGRYSCVDMYPSYRMRKNP